MAAVVSPSASGPSRAFPHAAFHPHHRNAFEAFAPHRHIPAASSEGSWRKREPVLLQPVEPKRARTSRRAPAHSRSPSASSASSVSSETSWRAAPRSPVVASSSAAADVSRDVRVYSASDLLALASSPLVGLSAPSQAVVEDLVAHHVWRRGSRARGAGNGRRGVSPKGSQSSSSSSDGEKSD